MSKRKKSKKLKPRNASFLDKDKSFTDFQCPICLEILIEPVQMPCQHELCMECFQTHVQDTSLNCPMCRLRISVWTRKCTKTNTLVNQERWELIQTMFPERVQRRLQGLDDIQEDDYANVPKRVIAVDGEVGKEFKEQMKKIEEEEEAISQSNMDYIRKIQEEERLERQKQEELDLVAAQELQKQEMANLGVTLKSPSQHQRELLALLRPKSPMKLRHRAEPAKPGSTPKSKTHRNILSSPNHTITSFFKKITDNSTHTNSHQDHGKDPGNCSKSITSIQHSQAAESHSKSLSNIRNNSQDSENCTNSISIIQLSQDTEHCSTKSTLTAQHSQDYKNRYKSLSRSTSSKLNTKRSEDTGKSTEHVSQEIIGDSPVFNCDTDFEIALSLQRQFDKQWERGKSPPLPLRTRNQIGVKTSSSTITSKAKRKVFDQDVIPAKIAKKM